MRLACFFRTFFFFYLFFLFFSLGSLLLPAWLSSVAQLRSGGEEAGSESPVAQRWAQGGSARNVSHAGPPLRLLAPLLRMAFCSTLAWSLILRTAARTSLTTKMGEEKKGSRGRRMRLSVVRRLQCPWPSRQPTQRRAWPSCLPAASLAGCLVLSLRFLEQVSRCWSFWCLDSGLDVLQAFCDVILSRVKGRMSQCLYKKGGQGW